MKYIFSVFTLLLFTNLISPVTAQSNSTGYSQAVPADPPVPESDYLQTSRYSEGTYQDSSIIYTVEYGPKPTLPPSLEPVFTSNYLSFENVYVVTDNWYYASRARADSVDADAFLIKGGSTSDEPFYDGRLDSFVELLKNPGRPTFGFCAGHQFLQMAQGSICAQRSGEQGYQTATIFSTDEIFNGSPNPYVGWAAHSFSIADIPDCYQNFATTRTCYVTFVKHITMPLYGTQLHIESSSHPSNAGPIILGNFRNQIMPRKFHGISESVGFPGEAGKVRLSWWKAKTSDPVTYRIFHATEKSALNFTSPIAETSELFYEMAGLDPDTIHYFAVRAVSAAFEDSNHTISSVKPDGHHKITFQNGWQGYQDCEATVIYHNYPTSNYGLRGSTAADTLYWWDSGLVQFKALEQYLEGKQIIGGKLNFLFAGGVDNSTNSSHEAHISIYRILKEWNEGQGRDHIEAQTGEVTWNSARHNIEDWEIPGCQGNSDRAAEPIASYLIKGDGTGISFDGTLLLPPQLIQTWVDHPDSNCGLLFEKTDTYPNDRYFYFEDNDDEWFMNHPRLIVYYLDDSTSSLHAHQEPVIPTANILSQNYPNPFNPATVISWQLPVSSTVHLTVYTITGQKVVTLVDKRLPAGSHSVEWNAFGQASGVYIYRLVAKSLLAGEAGEYVETRKMILMK